MTDSAETARLSGRISVPEERMKTRQAEYRTDIARLAEDMAKRETRTLLAVAGLISFGVVILGILIRLPPPA